VYNFVICVKTSSCSQFPGNRDPVNIPNVVLIRRIVVEYSVLNKYHYIIIIESAVVLARLKYCFNVYRCMLPMLVVQAATVSSRRHSVTFLPRRTRVLSVPMVVLVSLLTMAMDMFATVLPVLRVCSVLICVFGMRFTSSVTVI